MSLHNCTHFGTRLDLIPGKPHKNAPSTLGSGLPSYIRFSEHKSLPQNSILIGSAIFAKLTCMPNPQTNRQHNVRWALQRAATACCLWATDSNNAQMYACSRNRFHHFCAVTSEPSSIQWDCRKTQQHMAERESSVWTSTDCVDVCHVADSKRHCVNIVRFISNR